MAWGVGSFLLGMILGGIVVFRIRQNILKQAHAQIESLRSTTQEAEVRAGIKQEEARLLKEQLDSAHQRLEKAESDLQLALQEQARLSAEVVAAREHLQREREYIEASKKELESSFKALAAQALEGNNRQFVELAKSHLARQAEAASGDLARRQQAIEEVVRPLKENLEQYFKEIQALEKERQKSYHTVEGELKRVIEVSSKLSEETQGLKSALKKPHVRGRWGEVQLKTCLELAGMSEYADLIFQDSHSEDDKTLRPDLTVRMPGNKKVIVDAKTPIDAFLESLEATTEAERAQHMARHGQQVRDHVKKLATKAYQEHFKDAADFTVMFLPNESFLYAALESQPDLVEYALEKKILVATPPTFIGLLKVIRFGWNEDKLAQNAQLISDASRELHKRLVDFVEAFVNVGRHLERAQKEYEAGYKRLNSRVLTQARRLETLGVKGPKSLPEDMGYEELGYHDTRESSEDADATLS